MSQRRFDAAGITLLVIGVGALLNGIWMILDTARWFGLVAEVTGALNPHLVRDVGAAYAGVGGALIWAALQPAHRLPLTATAAVFLVIHAASHAVESLAGVLPPGHWIEDLPGVYLPAVLTLVLALRFARARP